VDSFRHDDDDDDDDENTQRIRDSQKHMHNYYHTTRRVVYC